MDFERVTAPDHPDFDWAFRLYEDSFPLHERRTRPAQEARLGCPDYHFDLLREGEALQGILLWWEGPGLRYVEHFAVAPQLRGRGVGARALARFRAQGEPVVLEIDPPVDPVSQSRRGFYLRCGFQENPWPHVHPPYRAVFSGHPLVVLSAPGALEREDYIRFARCLEETVMSDCVPPLEGD